MNLGNNESLEIVYLLFGMENYNISYCVVRIHSG